jgi:hypothetical protein
MNTPSSLHPRRQHAAHRPWWSAPAAFLVTLLALPVNAGVTIPPEPMTTGARIPPNILMVLDNSGSMQWDYMPDSVPSVSRSQHRKAGLHAQHDLLQPVQGLPAVGEPRRF